MSLSFTQANLDALKEALLTGATEVQIGDRVVKYRSQKEILKMINIIEEHLNGISSTSAPNTVVPSYSKGRSE